MVTLYTALFVTRRSTWWWNFEASSPRMRRAVAIVLFLSFCAPARFARKFAWLAQEFLPNS